MFWYFPHVLSIACVSAVALISSCNGHLYLYLIYLAMAIFILILFILHGHLDIYLYLIYLAMAIFIFILFYLWLQAFPLSFQLSGCLQWPSKAPTKKGIAFSPIIYQEYFYHPLGKFWREKLVSNICLISRYCLFSFNCHQWHRPKELLLVFSFVGISLQIPIGIAKQQKPHFKGNFLTFSSQISTFPTFLSILPLPLPRHQHLYSSITSSTGSERS